MTTTTESPVNVQEDTSTDNGGIDNVESSADELHRSTSKRARLESGSTSTAANLDNPQNEGRPSNFHHLPELGSSPVYHEAEDNSGTPGCDSGFGHMLAQRLDDLGFTVFAGCLLPDGDGASDLRKSGSNRMHVISLDVTSNDSVLEAAAYVEENLQKNVLWAVVNNAGVNLGCELHWTSLEIMKRVMEVNTFGVVRVTKAFLSKLKQSEGRIITVASAAGRYAFPGMVPYCMSKSAAIGFSDGLRLEMYKWNIQVITIEPWMYKTAILDEERTKKNILQTWESTSKEVQDLYGANYVKQYMKRSLKVISGYASPNPSEVVSLMEEAITTQHPEYSYSPGTIESTASLWFLQKLPKPIADLAMFYSMMGGRVPFCSR